MNKTKSILTLLLVTAFAPIIVAQEKADTKSNQWYNRLGTWVTGEPWSWDGNLSMTHTKYLMLIGGKGVQDTYLSPIAHNGIQAKGVFITDFAKPQDRKWHIYQDLSIYGGTLKNRSNGSLMYHLGVDYGIGPAWRLLKKNLWTLDIAPLLGLRFGGNIKMSNTNNIGNAKASFGLDGWGRVKYQIPWSIMPLSISYSAQVPLLMCAFHPEYGQSYYDYVSGENGAKLGLHFGSLHNTIGIKQRLLIDLPIHNLTITLGAEHTHFSQKLNHTDYKEGTWGIILGVSIDSFSISGGKSTSSTQATNSFQ